MNLRRAAVIGHPIAHTMSPYIHSRLFALSGLETEYTAMDVGDLRGSIPELRKLDAFNVTIPYKEKIIPFLDELDKKAKAFGSVNTVSVQNGRMTGHTTDGTGLMTALEQNDVSLSGDVLLLGSGGAARAIAFETAYAKRNIHMTIVCREQSRDKAEAIRSAAQAFAAGSGNTYRVISYEELNREDQPYGIVINATCVGMVPHVNACPAGPQVTARCDTVFDAVYNPGETQLMLQAKMQGKKRVFGMDMLVYQAVAAHKIWYGARFAPGDLRRLCYAAALPETIERMMSGSI